MDHLCHGLPLWATPPSDVRLRLFRPHYRRMHQSASLGLLRAKAAQLRPNVEPANGVDDACRPLQLLRHGRLDLLELSGLPEQSPP